MLKTKITAVVDSEPVIQLRILGGHEARILSGEEGSKK
jgi:hypothetical protein